jgi:hypothetical protein
MEFLFAKHSFVLTVEQLANIKSTLLLKTSFEMRESKSFTTTSKVTKK